MRTRQEERRRRACLVAMARDDEDVFPLVGVLGLGVWRLGGIGLEYRQLIQRRGPTIHYNSVLYWHWVVCDWYWRSHFFFVSLMYVLEWPWNRIVSKINNTMYNAQVGSGANSVTTSLHSKQRFGLDFSMEARTLLQLAAARLLLQAGGSDAVSEGLL